MKLQFHMRRAESESRRLSTSAINNSSHLPMRLAAHRNPPRRGGFTLMEVNIALLIMAIGILGLFSLFPVGLRQSEAASSDTVQASFADLVLNAMRSNAQMVTNWSGGTDGGWVGLTNGIALGVAATLPINGKVTVPTVSVPSVEILGDGQPHTLGDTDDGDGYLIKGQYIQYALHIEPDASDPNIVKAWIQITTRRYTDVTKAPIYATAFVFMGM
jgi:type II secretory pathway pseudopilin PulG